MIPNYLNNSAIEYLGENGEIFVKVWNDTGADIAKGIPKQLVTKWITGKGALVAPITGATNTAVANIIGIPLEAHVASTYGLYQIKGLCEYAVTSGTVAANDNLELINAGVALIDEGTDGGAVETVGAVAVAVSNVTTNVWKVFLRGKLNAVAAA